MAVESRVEIGLCRVIELTAGVIGRLAGLSGLDKAVKTSACDAVALGKQRLDPQRNLLFQSGIADFAGRIEGRLEIFAVVEFSDCRLEDFGRQPRSARLLGDTRQFHPDMGIERFVGGKFFADQRERVPSESRSAHPLNAQSRLMRSEERRVGKEGVSACRYRWVPDP